MKKAVQKTYRIDRLSNGVRVVAAPLKERSSVSVGIWVNTGGRDEKAEISGVSHFLEHIVFKGTKTRSANQIKESVEGIGGSLNAFTSEEYTCFLAKAASRHFESVFEVLADMVLNPSIKEDDIKKERTVIMEEIKMTQDQPSQLADETLAELIWPQHPLGRPLAGTLETVGAMTRAQIVDYKERFYTPNLVTISAAGNIDQKRLLRAAKRVFTRMKGTNEKKIDLFHRNQTLPRVRLVPKSTEQTHLSLGLHTFAKSHADEFTLDVLSILMGGNMSSRLFNEVREERGLAYDIGSSVRKYHETGAFGVEAGVDTKKAIEALSVILKELKKTTKEHFKPDEIKRAKEFYLGQLELGLENSMNHMLWMGESVVSLGRTRTVAEVIRRVQSITAEDLKRVAGEVFKSQNINLAVVGPKADSLEKDLKRELNFNGN